MRLRISCMQCFKEQGHPSDYMMSVELRNDGLYAAVCEKGHRTLTVLQQQKFEVLFDLGAMALLDGYPREAISSIVAALERFYEFYARVICLKHGVDPDLLNRAWKHVENQSERQFGAYVFVSMLDRPTMAPMSIEDLQPTLQSASKTNTRTWRSFRNAVVHKGYIPSTPEALAYGDLAFMHINQLLQQLKESSGKYIDKATFLSLSRVNAAGMQQGISTFSIPTLISLTRAETAPSSLEGAMKELEKYRKWLHHK